MNMQWVEKRRLLYWNLAYKHLSKEEYHKTMGYECGIPECCINYFVLNHHLQIAFITDLKYGIPKIKNKNRSGFEYVMCPKCRKEVGTIKTTYKELKNIYDGI